MRALLGKELRQLLPLTLALMALNLISTVEILWRQPLDELTWAELSVLLGPHQSAGVAGVLFAIAVLTAYMLYPREHDQGSINFLYSLPVRPSAVFAVKLMAALLVLLGINTLDYLLLSWMASANTSSISGSQFSVSFWLLEWAMVSGFLVIGLCYGMLISFFRRFGLLLAAIGVGVLGVFTDNDPGLLHLDLLSLLFLEFDGARPIIETRGWVVHGIAAGLCLVLARFLWLSRAEAFTAFNTRVSRRAITRAASVVVVVGGIAGLGLMTVLQNQRLAGDGVEEEAQPVDILTQRYHFRYLPADRAGALALSREADAGHEALRTLLGATQVSRIVADLTERSGEHLGIAGWQKMRIERGVLGDPQLRRHVLYHETAHVLAAAESRQRLAEHREDGQFFSEGMAEWAALRLLPDSASRGGLLDLAASAWQRFDLRFGDLLSSSTFAARHDEWLVYALGFAWVDALATACGDGAPGEALRAMGREDAPGGLRGRRFWQQILQATGCDLGAVNARFASTLSGRHVSPERIPRVRGGLFNASDELLVFELTLEPVDPDRTYQVAVRVRDGAHVGRTGILRREVELRGAKPALLYVPNTGLSGSRFQFQMGVEVVSDQPMYYERWQDASF